MAHHFLAAIFYVQQKRKESYFWKKCQHVRNEYLVACSIQKKWNNNTTQFDKNPLQSNLNPHSLHVSFREKNETGIGMDTQWECWLQALFGNTGKVGLVNE